MDTYLQAGLQAISDPTRLAILQRLADSPLPVVELTRGFSMSRPAISQHLRILKDAGLVTNRAHGTQRIYEIDSIGIETLRAHFDSLWSEVLGRFQSAAKAPIKAASTTESTHVRARKKVTGQPKRR